MLMLVVVVVVVVVQCIMSSRYLQPLTIKTNPFSTPHRLLMCNKVTRRDKFVI